MPKAARKKSPEGIYHVMARSIPEFDLFPSDDDKNHFLDLLQLLKDKNHCRIYAYCLMSNHYHILIDTNGYDISKFMKSLNLRHVKYINKVYKRRGHLLDDRFNSKIVSDFEGLLTVSAYIHNNAKDISGYSNKVFEYPYSSMEIYLGRKKDTRNLIDTDFILGSIYESKKEKAIKAYSKMVIEKADIGTNQQLRKYLEDFKNEQYEYKSYRTIMFRDRKPDEVTGKIAERYGFTDTRELMHRWKRSSMALREAVAYALTTFCDMGTKQVCEYMKNISGTCLSRLREKGFNRFRNDSELMRILSL